MNAPTNILIREQVAARVAEDLQDNWLANLSIGMPTQIPVFVPLILLTSALMGLVAVPEAR